MATIDDVPNEILLHILSYLSAVRDGLSVFRVSQRLRAVAAELLLWSQPTSVLSVRQAYHLSRVNPRLALSVHAKINFQQMSEEGKLLASIAPSLSALIVDVEGASRVFPYGGIPHVPSVLAEADALVRQHFLPWMCHATQLTRLRLYAPIAVRLLALAPGCLDGVIDLSIDDKARASSQRVYIEHFFALCDGMPALRALRANEGEIYSSDRHEDEVALEAAFKRAPPAGYQLREFGNFVISQHERSMHPVAPALTRFIAHLPCLEKLRTDPRLYQENYQRAVAPEVWTPPPLRFFHAIDRRGRVLDGDYPHLTDLQITYYQGLVDMEAQMAVLPSLRSLTLYHYYYGYAEPSFDARVSDFLGIPAAALAPLQRVVLDLSFYGPEASSDRARELYGAVTRLRRALSLDLLANVTERAVHKALTDVYSGNCPDFNDSCVVESGDGWCTTIHVHASAYYDRSAGSQGETVESCSLKITRDRVA